MHTGVHAWRRVAAMTVVAAALGCMAAVSPAAGATKHLPCTRKTIAAGLKRGVNKLPGAAIESSPMCAGRFAVALVVYKRIPITAVFRARGANWVSIDRTKPCKDRSIPKKICVAACMTN